MKLGGHRRITSDAVKEFLGQFRGERRRWYRGQLYRPRRPSNWGPGGETSPADHAVGRDILDVLTLGHWSNFAQKHHFMRRFDGQSPYQAWVDACNWISGNARQFADAAARGVGRSALAELGYACHAVEDSFARGHVVRATAGGPTQPGAIEHVKMYAGKEKEGHSHLDTTWEATGGGLSLEGRLAKNAVKGLLQLAFDEAVAAARAGRRGVPSLTGWNAYRDHWLRASPELSRRRDRAYDLVDEFYSGVVWGDTNTAVDFDEEGLARAIYDRLATDAGAVHAVFTRLNEYHTADADDVAVYYVDLLRGERTPRVGPAIGRDRRLVDLLIRIMDEGYTSDGEQACIDYLNSLRR